MSKLGASFAAIGALTTIYGMATNIMPPIPPAALALKVVAFLAQVGAMGCGAGILFSSIVARADRTRDFSRLSPRRFGLWGFVAGSCVFLSVNVANSILVGAPFDRSRIVRAVVYGIVGATIGAATFVVAKRARSVDATSASRETLAAQ